MLQNGIIISTAACSMVIIMMYTCAAYLQLDAVLSEHGCQDRYIKTVLITAVQLRA